jgi:hypothetical protein
LLGVFISLMMIFILPVWLTHSFVTINGPFDFYLAQVFFNLSNPESNFHAHYAKLNVEFSGSFKLAIMYIKSGFGSNTLFDKLLFSFWIASFLLLSRRISITLNPKGDYRPFLFFSIVFCAPLINGDWNFLGAVLFFLLGFRIITSVKNGTDFLGLFLALAVCSFFILWCSFLWFVIFSAMLYALIFFHPHESIRKLIRPAFAAPLIAFILPSFFFKTEGWEFEFVNIMDPLKGLIKLDLLQTFSEPYWVITLPLSVLFGILSVYSLINVFFFLKPNLELRFWHRLNIAFSFISVAIYLTLNNKNDNEFGETFVFLAIVFLFFSLSCLRIKKIYMLLAGLFCLVITIEHLRMQFLSWDRLSIKAQEFQTLELNNDHVKAIEIQNNHSNKNSRNLPYLLSRSNPSILINEPHRPESDYTSMFLKRKSLQVDDKLCLLSDTLQGQKPVFVLENNKLYIIDCK